MRKMQDEDRASAVKIQEVDGLLVECYGDRIRGAGGYDLLDGLVLTILSQNTSDVNSQRAFEDLKCRFPSWEEAARAGAGEIEVAIRSGGISHVKAGRIKDLLDSLQRETGSYSLRHLEDMEPPKALEYLLEIPGVGRKTAAVLLLFRLGYPFFPVDTHIFRVGKRLGILPPRISPDKAHDLMDELVPDDTKYRFHINLITHGKQVCKARKPNCRECCLTNICERVGVEEEGNDNA
ncbi:MAG: endonuclease III [Actinomycetota bacterium]|nr:endonuclease III [Actinomycetota bacterium]